MTISAVLIVYNEEARLEHILKCVNWCDEIVVVDRNSSDRTREIALRYTSKVLILANREFSPSDNQVWLSAVTSEWVLAVTASDVLHPGLAKDIRELISAPEFPYDVIHVPFRRYVLGMETKHSPWYTELSPLSLYRKSVLRINPESVHGALTLETDRRYKMRNSETNCVYHLTHSTADIMMDRHTLYWRAEARTFPSGGSLWKVLLDLLRGLYVVLFKRRTFMLGWDGIALIMAYLSYWMMRFVYIWEARQGKASTTYATIRSGIEMEWAAERKNDA